MKMLLTLIRTIIPAIVFILILPVRSSSLFILPVKSLTLSYQEGNIRTKTIHIRILKEKDKKEIRLEGDEIWRFTGLRDDDIQLIIRKLMDHRNADIYIIIRKSDSSDQDGQKEGTVDQE